MRQANTWILPALWLVTALGWGSANQGNLLRHDGSNTYWYAIVRLDLDSDLGAVAVANDAGKKTGPSMHAALSDVLPRVVRP